MTRWIGLTMGDIKPAVQTTRPRLATIESEGVEYLVDLASRSLGRAAPSGETGAATARIRRAFPDYKRLAAEHERLVYPGNNDVFKATVVSGGNIVATWNRGRKGAVDATGLSPSARPGSDRSRTPHEPCRRTSPLGASCGPRPMR